MKKSKKRNTIMLLILLVCGITIGFALLSTTLYINGSGIVKGNKWDIHWENVDNEDGVDAQTPVIDSNKTTVTYEINLVNPGDFYSFTVDAVNSGSLDGVINRVESKFYESDGETEIELPSYLSYSVTYEDGSPIEKGQRLNSQEEKTYKVKVKYNTNVEAEELPTTNQTILSKFTVEYVQADVEVDAVSFAKDPWDVIADCAKLGTCPYEVGDTRIEKIDIDGDGTEEEYTLRIANMSTPSECSKPGFSQTACGFVVEFQDIIATHRMNPYEATRTIGDGNRGNWKESDMRAYLNSTTYAAGNIDYSNTGIYDKLPSALKKAIIPTKVISSWGYDPQVNGVTTDKLYLFAAHEVWEYTPDYTTSYSGIDINTNDTTYDITRQLDYYKEKGVTVAETSFNGPARKNYGDSYSRWWLRSALYYNDYLFYGVDYGHTGTYVSSEEGGVSPAFRVG